MRFIVDKNQQLSPCKLTFFVDGSFGQTSLSLDYEICLNYGGSLSLNGSLFDKRCYSLSGYSWKSFKQLKKHPINIDKYIDGALLFELDNNDRKEFGTLYNLEMKPTFLDDSKKLVLFGKQPQSSTVIRFAEGQYICILQDIIVGFVVELDKSTNQF